MFHVLILRRAIFTCLLLGCQLRKKDGALWRSQEESTRLTRNGGRLLTIVSPLLNDSCVRLRDSGSVTYKDTLIALISCLPITYLKLNLLFITSQLPRNLLAGDIE